MERKHNRKEIDRSMKADLLEVEYDELKRKAYVPLLPTSFEAKQTHWCSISHSYKYTV